MNWDAALSRGEIKLSYSARLGFLIIYQDDTAPLSGGGIAKITSKFVRALALSPYFAPQELKELSTLAQGFERERLKRSPSTGPIIDNIKQWFQRSQLRQSQLKEWLSSAPQLFVSDILREHNFEMPLTMRQRITSATSVSNQF